MFGFGAKKKPAPRLLDDAPVAAAEPVTPIGEIRTMPDRFLTRGRGFSSKRSGSRRWLMIIVIAVLILAILGAGGWLLQRMLRQSGEETNRNANVNTNAVANQNASNANSNVNTNTAREITDLGDTLLVKSELGEGYANYDESEVVETSAAIAEVTAQRAQKIFSLEEAGKSTLSLTMTVWEAPSAEEGQKIFDFQRTRRSNQVEAGQGEFLNRTTPAGEQSFYFQNLA